MAATTGRVHGSSRLFSILGALLVLAFFAATSISQDAKAPGKIVVLFDSSASMGTVDGPLPPGVDPATLPSRQERVVQFLTAKAKKGGPAFLEQLMQRGPVIAYRFGAELNDVIEPDADKPWSADEWRRWLKPQDGAGTNIAGSALRMLREEAGNGIQAIVIVSDGRSNRSAADQVKDLLAQVSDAKIPVITIGVGNPKPGPSLRIGQLQTSETVRPGQRFIVRVPIESRGLAGEEIPLTLEAVRVSDAAGKALNAAKSIVPGPKKAKLKADGPTLVDFDIDLEALHKNVPPADLHGTWRFTAKVPRHPREAFAGAEHVSEPAAVVVQERKLRVLLFAGGASREYQFLRTLLVRQVLDKRLDLSVLLQTGQDDGVDQDVDGDKLLKRFPDKLAGVYDVILSFDPDWTILTAKQLKTLNEWVDKHGGGLLFSAGRINGHQLARPGGFDLSSVQALVPVVLKDHRLHGIGLMEPDATRPYPLRFTPKAKDYPFLKLDHELPGPTAGWNSFFWNNEKFDFDPANPAKPRRGFFTYYPVERIKAASEVIAGFAGPKESRIGAGTNEYKDQQPFIVAMPFGVGRTMYLGSSEFWRLRQVKESYYERFWFGMIAYLVRQRTEKKGLGQILTPRSPLAGAISFEAQLLDANQKPIPADRPMRAEIRDARAASSEPLTVDLQPAANRAGWFLGTGLLKRAGEYTIRIAIEPDAEISHRLTIREVADELDDERVDFSHLHQLSSKADPVLQPLKADARKAVEAALRRSAELAKDAADPNSPRLFFQINDADAILNCVGKLPTRLLPKIGAEKPLEPMESVFKEKKTQTVLIIDGAGAAGLKDGGDARCISAALQSVPGDLYKPVYAHDLPLCREAPSLALERNDLNKFTAIFLLNVPQLLPEQITNLEKFSKAGGGVVFFLGPRVDGARYNATLYRDGKGIFPAPLAPTYFPPASEKPRAKAVDQSHQLLLRDDLFPEMNRYAILGPVFTERRMRDVLADLPIGRYFKVSRDQWKNAKESLELATLPNDAPANTLAKRVADLTQGPLRTLIADPSQKPLRPQLERHRGVIESTVGAASEKRCIDLASAIENCLLDRSLADFWKSADVKVRALLIDLAKLRHDARYGDPLIVAGEFGKGRVVAFMTSAGTQWNQFAFGSLGSIVYAPVVWETANYVTRQDTPASGFAQLPAPIARAPQFVGVDLGYSATMPFKGKNELKELGPVYLATLDAAIPFAGALHSPDGLGDLRWEVDVRPMPIPDKKAIKNPPSRFTLTIPMQAFHDRRRQRSLDELTQQVLRDPTTTSLPAGYSLTHALTEETSFDFRRHLARLKPKDGDPQWEYLVKVSIVATSAGTQPKTASRAFHFLVVTENELVMQTQGAQENDVEDLRKAHESLDRSQVLLDEQIAKLQAADVDIEGVSVRVAQVKRDIALAADLVAKASHRLDRHLTEFDVNRVKLSHVKAVEATADSLRKLLDDGGNLRRFESALHKASLALEKNQKQAALVAMQAARPDLSRACGSLGKTIESMEEGLTELKLIAMLAQIERSQRGVSADLRFRWHEHRRLAIEELLKGPATKTGK